MTTKIKKPVTTKEEAPKSFIEQDVITRKGVVLKPRLLGPRDIMKLGPIAAKTDIDIMAILKIWGKGISKKGKSAVQVEAEIEAIGKQRIDVVYKEVFFKLGNGADEVMAFLAGLCSVEESVLDDLDPLEFARLLFKVAMSRGFSDSLANS